MENDNDFLLVMFKSQTAVEDDTIAYEFLNQANWDPSKAADLYYESLDKNFQVPDLVSRYSDVPLASYDPNTRDKVVQKINYNKSNIGLDKDMYKKSDSNVG